MNIEDIFYPFNGFMRRTLILLIAMAGLVGCATPRFETVTYREAPSDPLTQSCLQECDARLNACKLTCADNYQACIKSLEPLAEEHYRQTLDRYAAELERYRWDMANYELHLWFNWNWSHSAFWYAPWPYPYSFLPPPPRPPSREADLNHFRQEKCGGDCGCQAPYDACFLACGGKIISEQRCVKNCPKAQ